MSGLTAVLVLIIIALHRWLTIMSVGDAFAAGRGVTVSRARMLLMVLVALQTSVVTSMIGPVAFVGLLGPHMAALLGARSAQQQLLFAGLLGITLMLAADWLGRVILFPQQASAGLLASVIGGSYFIWLLATRRIA